MNKKRGFSSQAFSVVASIQELLTEQCRGLDLLMEICKTGCGSHEVLEGGTQQEIENPLFKGDDKSHDIEIITLIL